LLNESTIILPLLRNKKHKQFVDIYQIYCLNIASAKYRLVQGQTLILDFLLVIGLALSVLIVVLARVSKNKKSAKRFLITIYSIYICYFIDTYIRLHDIKSLFVFGLLISTGLGFLIAPIIFMYVRSLVYNSRYDYRKVILHFLPFIIHWFGFVLLFAISYAQKEWVFDYVKFIYTQWDFVSLIEDVYIIVYALLGYISLKKARLLLKKNYSTLDGIDLDWLNKLLIGVILVITLDFVTSIYVLFYDSEIIDRGYLTASGVVFLSIYLGYYGVTRSRVLIPDFLFETSSDIPNEDKTKKSTRLSNLPEEAIEGLKISLIEVLENQKPYKDDALTLGTLAEMMSISDKKLSELINLHLETNFYDLINSYRVSEVKEKISSDQYKNLTLLGMAYDSGFKSKTSFNRVFKQQVGMSPSKYKSNQANSLV